MYKKSLVYLSNLCFWIQPDHPNPGLRYAGTNRKAYLPNNDRGRKVAALLRLAFDSGLTFTIGTSSTTGFPNSVIWNGIHHKTELYGGV